MIIYPTKKTVERFNIPMPTDFEYEKTRNYVQSVINAEKDDRLLQWGMKIFYFDGRKCLQVSNFASKLTFFFIDIKKSEFSSVPHWLTMFMNELYEDDTQMQALIEQFFLEHNVICFDKLTDKAAIATLNRTEIDFLWSGDRLYKYISDNILHSRQLNNDVNRDYLVTIKINGKTDYVFPAEYFKKLLIERYSNQNTTYTSENGVYYS